MNALKKGFRGVCLVVILAALALMAVGTFTVFHGGPWPWIVFVVCAVTVASYLKGEGYADRRVRQALATAKDRTVIELSSVLLRASSDAHASSSRREEFAQALMNRK